MGLLGGLGVIFWIVFAIIWCLVCPLLSGFIAKEKGYSYGSWFGISFFFGVIGLLAAVGLPDRKSAILSQQGTAEDYFNQGIDYGKTGKSQEQINCYNKTIELDPSHHNAYNNRGIVYYRLGQIQEAISDFEKAIELNPKYAMPYYNLACIYSSQGKKSDALVNLEKAIGLNKKYRKDVKIDNEFKFLWDDPDFKKLVE